MNTPAKQKENLNSHLEDGILTLFIVDDNVAYLGMLKDKFSKNIKYNIYTFTSGEDCLENLYLKPNIVILDYHLTEGDSKGLDGDQVLELILKKSPRTKVIMISGDEKIQLLSSDFNNLGASDSLLKNYDTATRIKIFSNELITKKNRKQVLFLFFSLLFITTLVIIIINLFV